MMTIASLKSNGFKPFDELPLPEKEQHIQTIKYLDTLSASSGTNISNWDLQMFFHGGKLLADKNKINRIFFSARDEFMRANEKNPALSESQQNHLDVLERTIPARVANKNHEIIQSHMYMAEQHYERYLENVRAARELQIIVDSVDGLKVNLKGQVDSLVRTGFWTLHAVTDEVISLRNTNDVLCRYKNTAQGIDVTVNFGKFIFDYNPKNARVSYQEFENNKRFGNCVHPHLYDYGICFGATGPQAGRFMREANLVELFNLIASILVSYNPQDAYVDIVRFHAIEQGKEDPYLAQEMARETDEPDEDEGNF